MQFHHIPVLAEQTIELLGVRDGATYIDGTLGGGGHAGMILARGAHIRLIGIDRDEIALAAATARLSSYAGFTALHGNYRDARALLAQIGVARIDGALLDLGVSSPQFDAPERGFSYRADAPLDMRMDQTQRLTAREIVNAWPQAEIARILREYGEENWSAHIARVLCDRRERAPIETTAQLVDVIDAAIPKRVRAKDDSHPARRAFQALRIAVNDELAPLEAALRDFAQMLVPGGRLCVITFHSLEDRIVKRTFRAMERPCVCPPSSPICTCGRKPIARVLTSRGVRAGEGELADNPRARSATLRAVERLEDAHGA